MVSFANPVAGVIHPSTWTRPAGNTDFRVVAPFGALDDDHATPHTGLDLGDGAADADVVRAARAGEVVARIELDGKVRIDHGDGWLTVYAHMLLPFEVSLHQQVAAGERIGRIGATGTRLAHLHFETKQLVNGALVHRDPWPLLAQNQEDEVTTITITRFEPTRRWAAPTAGSYRGFKLGAPVKSLQLGAGSSAVADGQVEVSPLPDGWPTGPLLRVFDGGFKGFFIEAAKVTLQPATVDPCAEVVAGLERRIAAIKAKAAALGADVADD